jgi:hypothetical protein
MAAPGEGVVAARDRGDLACRVAAVGPLDEPGAAGELVGQRGRALDRVMAVVGLRGVLQRAGQAVGPVGHEGEAGPAVGGEVERAVEAIMSGGEEGRAAARMGDAGAVAVELSIVSLELLGDVVRDIGNDQAGEAGHGCGASRSGADHAIKYCAP